MKNKTLKFKILIDYTNYIKKCVSIGTEINKETIKNYLKEDYYYEKRV